MRFAGKGNREVFDRGSDPLAKVMVAAVPILVVLVIVVVTMSVHAKRSAQSVEAMAAAPAFTVAGPPCVVATYGDLIRQHAPPVRTLEFNGVRFGRNLGHAECAWVETKEHFGARGYPVCQFTSPGGLEVKTRRGVYVFLPGQGKPATVSVIDGVARCVVGGVTVPQMLKVARERRN